MLHVRDFIYMDTDRIRSIVAQLQEGLTESIERSTSRSGDVATGAKGSFLGFLSADAQAKFVYEAGQHETKTLHDHIYNVVEAELSKSSDLISIPACSNHTQSEAARVRDSLKTTSFVLASGKFQLEHFPYMRQLLEAFPDLAKAMALFSVQSQVADLNSKDRERVIQQAMQKFSIDKKQLDGLKLFFDTFYQARIAIKVAPFSSVPDFQLVGPLQEAYLRDDIMSIIYKYGTAPSAEWTVFAQVADIPADTPDDFTSASTGGEIQVALGQMFAGLRPLERMAQSVRYPSISVTPIAIYRQ